MRENFITITDARKTIFSITDRVAKKNLVFTLTEHGLPKAILLSPKHYDFLTQEKEKSRPSETIFFLPPAWSVRDASRQTYSADNDNLLSVPSSRGHVDVFANAKKIAAAQLFIQLAEEYRHPSECLHLDVCVRTEGYHGNRSIDIDILLTDAQGNPKALFLVAPFQKYESLKRQSFRDLFELNQSLKKEYKCSSVQYLVYFTRTVGDTPAKNLWTVVNASTFSSFQKWEKAGSPAETKFPKEER